jgi:hypothetical protein
VTGGDGEIMRVRSLGTIVFLSVTAALFTAAVSASEQAHKDAEARAVLAKLVGTWATEVKLSEAVWTPKAQEFKGVTTGAAIVQGQAVQLTGGFLPGMRGFSLTIAYDEKHQRFRALFLDGEQVVLKHDGQWDAGAKILSLHGFDLPPTSLNRCTLHFVDADTCVVHVMLKDRIMKQYFVMQARLTRKK